MMTHEELEALCERVWFGPAFTFQVVDETTIRVMVDVRSFWPGGPRSLAGTTHLSAEMSAGQVVIALLEAAGAALVHELQEQTTVDGMRWATPHQVALFRVAKPQQPTVQEGDHDD